MAQVFMSYSHADEALGNAATSTDHQVDRHPSYAPINGHDRSASNATGERTGGGASRPQFTFATSPRVGADFAVYDEVGDAVEVGGLAIQDDEGGAGLLGEYWQPGGGVDDERRADGEEEVAGQRLALRALHLVLRHRLAEGDRRRLDRRSAERAGGRHGVPLERLLDRSKLVTGLAGDAFRIAAVAVELDHLLPGYARILVQVVDVLGDHARDLAEPDQLGDRPVPAVGRGARDVPVDQQLAPPGLDTCLLGGEEVLVIDRRGLRSDAGRAAEVRDARLGRYTGAGKDDSPARVRDRPGEALDIGLRALHLSRAPGPPRLNLPWCCRRSRAQGGSTDKARQDRHRRRDDWPAAPLVGRYDGLRTHGLCERKARKWR